MAWLITQCKRKFDLFTNTCRNTCLAKKLRSLCCFIFVRRPLPLKASSSLPNAVSASSEMRRRSSVPDSSRCATSRRTSKVLVLLGWICSQSASSILLQKSHVCSLPCRICLGTLDPKWAIFSKSGQYFFRNGQRNCFHLSNILGCL